MAEGIHDFVVPSSTIDFEKLAALRVHTRD